MSDKPRVYQGVRVKTTVKELLQRHRAREANSKKLKPISQTCLDLQELCPSIFPNVIPSGRYGDPPPAVTPADAASCGARAPQMRTPQVPVPDGSCSGQMQGDAFNDVQQHFGDVTLPSNCFSVSSGCSSSNNNSSNSNLCGDGYSNASLPAAHTYPLPWYYGLSSDADYYGHAMASSSPPDSLKLYSPLDHNSCSPQDSFSSSSSSCYDSPTRMEPSHPGFTSEHYHYQYCNLQDCYCLSHCWPGQQETFSAPECTAYYNSTDYPYACQVEENCFRRDLQMSPEMCYNVL